MALGLQARGLNVVLTDKEERLLGGLRVEKDDIFSPCQELYRGASLLYSIRPPLEMQLAMGLLASLIGADVLVRPLMDEVAELPGFARRLVNRGEARFYLFIGEGLATGGAILLLVPSKSTFCSRSDSRLPRPDPPATGLSCGRGYRTVGL